MQMCPCLKGKFFTWVGWVELHKLNMKRILKLWIGKTFSFKTPIKLNNIDTSGVTNKNQDFYEFKRLLSLHIGFICII